MMGSVILAGAIAVIALLLLLLVVRSTARRNREIAESAGLWTERGYQCPGCGSQMSEGWIMAGRGLIWSDRDRGMPGPFSNIMGALPNTISMSIRPASNQSWRCPRCQLVLVDHSRLVAPGARRRH